MEDASSTGWTGGRSAWLPPSRLRPSAARSPAASARCWPADPRIRAGTLPRVGRRLRVAPAPALRPPTGRKGRPDADAEGRARARRLRHRCGPAGDLHAVQPRDADAQLAGPRGRAGERPARRPDAPQGTTHRNLQVRGLHRCRRPARHRRPVGKRLGHRAAASRAGDGDLSHQRPASAGQRPDPAGDARDRAHGRPADAFRVEQGANRPSRRSPSSASPRRCSTPT